MDSEQPVDDVGVAIRSDWIHALDVLEEEELSDEFGVLDWVYGYGGK